MQQLGAIHRDANQAGSIFDRPTYEAPPTFESGFGYLMRGPVQGTCDQIVYSARRIFGR
jgi:hypothetical protein